MDEDFDFYFKDVGDIFQPKSVVDPPVSTTTDSEQQNAKLDHQGKENVKVSNSEPDDEAESNYFTSSNSGSNSRPGTRGSDSSSGTMTRCLSIDIFESQKSNSSIPDSVPKTPVSIFDVTNEESNIEDDDMDDFLTQFEMDSLSPPASTPARSVSSHSSRNRLSTQDTVKTSFTDFRTLFQAAKTKVRRRFPGPAGLLPDLKPGEFSCLNSPSKSHPVSQQIEQILSRSNPQNCSQTLSIGSEIPIFERSTWSELRQRLGLDSLNENSPLEIMNIDWILTKAKRFPVAVKIPFLAAALQDAPELVNAQTGKFKPPCVKLVDPSGTILASLEANFASTYAHHLNAGTSLALQNVGLLHLKRQLVLTITSKNIIFMTSYSENAEQTKKKFSAKDNSVELTTDDGVKVTMFNDFSPRRIVNTYNQLDNLRSIAWNNEMENSDSRQLQNSGSHNPLFSTVVSNPPSSSSSNQFQELSAPKNSITSNSTANQDVFDDDEEEFFRALGDVDFLAELDNS